MDNGYRKSRGLFYECGNYREGRLHSNILWLWKGLCQVRVSLQFLKAHLSAYLRTKLHASAELAYI